LRKLEQARCGQPWFESWIDGIGVSA